MRNKTAAATSLLFALLVTCVFALEGKNFDISGGNGDKQGDERVGGLPFEVRLTVPEELREGVVVEAKNILTGETSLPVEVCEGVAKFDGLLQGCYRVSAQTAGYVGTEWAHVTRAGESASLAMTQVRMVGGNVASASEDDIVVFIGGADSYFAPVGPGGGYVAEVPAGEYNVMVLTASGREYATIGGQTVSADAKLNIPVSDKTAERTSATASAMSLGVPTIDDYNDSFFESKYTQAQKRINEGLRLLNLAGQVSKPTGEYLTPENLEIYNENYRTVQIFRYRLVNFMKNTRMADPYKAIAMFGKSVHDTARSYFDFWIDSKAKAAEKAYGAWAGGIFNARKTLAGYAGIKGIDAIESFIGEFETEAASFKDLVDQFELSWAYVEKLIHAAASLKNLEGKINDYLELQKAKAVINNKDLASIQGSIHFEYVDMVLSMAELVSDWLRTGEETGSWVFGRLNIDEWMSEMEAYIRDFAQKLPLRQYELPPEQPVTEPGQPSVARKDDEPGADDQRQDGEGQENKLITGVVIPEKDTILPVRLVPLPEPFTPVPPLPEPLQPLQPLRPLPEPLPPLPEPFTPVPPLPEPLQPLQPDQPVTRPDQPPSIVTPGPGAGVPWWDLIGDVVNDIFDVLRDIYYPENQDDPGGRYPYDGDIDPAADPWAIVGTTPPPNPTDVLIEAAEKIAGDLLDHLAQRYPWLQDIMGNLSGGDVIRGISDIIRDIFNGDWWKLALDALELIGKWFGIGADGPAEVSFVNNNLDPGASGSMGKSLIEQQGAANAGNGITAAGLNTLRSQVENCGNRYTVKPALPKSVHGGGGSGKPAKGKSVFGN